MAKRIIIAGGGTGGHIFPAVAVAQALMRQNSDQEILFVGAKGKMEMEKVPEAGFKIVGLDIAGFNRNALWKNISLPYKLIKSFFQTDKIFRQFKPDAVFGVGGYSSFPVLKYAQQNNVPSFLHESNAFAGKSNVLLGTKATKVFTGTGGMERFFPRDKIVVTGNPIRQNIIKNRIDRAAAKQQLGFDKNLLLVLVVGGSQGAGSINKKILELLGDFQRESVQLLWQTGKTFFETAKIASERFNTIIQPTAFINDMPTAYAAADIVVSRAGAMSVAELAVAGKAVVFVPFPFAAEDHQTYNAMNLVNADAAKIVHDEQIDTALWSALQQLIQHDELRKELETNISHFSITNADEVIAQQILSAIEA